MTEHFINRSQTQAEYTIIPNHLSNDENLTWEARGVLLYLLSKPPDWKVNRNDLINRSPAGLRVVKRVLIELQDKKYMFRTRHKDSKGRFFWLTYVYDFPQLGLEFPSKSSIGTKCTSGERTHIVSNESTKDGKVSRLHLSGKRKRLPYHRQLRPKSTQLLSLKKRRKKQPPEGDSLIP